MNRILYFHGFASSPNSGKAQFFAARFRARGVEIEIPDLAAGDFEHLTITSQLALIARLAGDEPVSLIGSSLGGYLAALLAAAHPTVHRLVLLAPAFGFSHRLAESLGAPRVAEWERTGSMDVFHYGDVCTRKLHYGLLEDGRRYPDYPDFPQPALIFHGAHDDVVPASCSAHFAASHPDAHLEVLDSGHDLHNVLDYMAPRAIDFLLAR